MTNVITPANSAKSAQPVQHTPRQYDENLVTANINLVHSIAHRFEGRGIEYDELYSAGCVGLVKAAKRFERERGLMFSTYATPVIMGEIKRIFRDGGEVKVSRSLRELSLRVCRVRAKLFAAGGEPTLSEIAAELGVSTADVAEAVAASKPCLSLNGGDNSDGGGDIVTQAASLSACSDSPDSGAGFDALALKQALSHLSGYDRKVIILRYWGDKTQAETGRLLGISQVQVCRLEKRILKLLHGELS
ncbi:RNA polymerase sigma factor [Clostridia bacterium]|nr:RNA polymerase sigma factor [Clostridia bacterium]